MFTEPESIEPEIAVRRTNALVWATMLLVGWVLFELTAEEGLSALVACSKFGWNDWLTSRWLWKTDPVRPRALACGWFYCASGMWKVGVAATIGIWLLMVIAVIAVSNAAAPPAFYAIGIEVLAGFGIAALATAIASLLAWWSGQKIWVDSALHVYRRENLWPPDRRLGANRVKLLVLSALIFWLVPLAVGAAALLLMSLNYWQAPWPVDVAIAVVVMAGLAVGLPIFLLAASERISRRVAAESPRECWPEAARVAGILGH